MISIMSSLRFFRIHNKLEGSNNIYLKKVDIWKKNQSTKYLSRTVLFLPTHTVLITSSNCICIFIFVVHFLQLVKDNIRFNFITIFRILSYTRSVHVNLLLQNLAYKYCDATKHLKFSLNIDRKTLKTFYYFFYLRQKYAINNCSSLDL